MRNDQSMTLDAETIDTPAQTYPVNDLRSALRLLEATPGQLLRTDHPVDVNAELAGVYRHVGAGCPVEPPTKIGPAMMFQNIKGYPGARVVTGVMASRERVGLLLNTPPRQLGFKMLEALEHPIDPVITPDKTPLCQQVVYRENIDILKTLPVPTNTPKDAGPYVCWGFFAPPIPRPESTMSPCTGSVSMVPISLASSLARKHIDAFLKKAEKMNKPFR